MNTSLPFISNVTAGILVLFVAAARSCDPRISGNRCNTFVGRPAAWLD
jgi:hypothetical protein